VTTPLTSALRPAAARLDTLRARCAMTRAGRPGPCLYRLRVAYAFQVHCHARSKERP
jgi:hypothetical protein